MNDHDLIRVYTQAYNAARSQGGQRETPHQHAHVAGLRALADQGGVLETAASVPYETIPEPERLPNEDKAAAHQRRLTSCQYWLDQKGRRQVYAANPTFTAITDAFAAGGSYERAHFEGNREHLENSEDLIAKTADDVAAALQEAQLMAPLFDEIVAKLGVPPTADDIMTKLNSLLGGIPHAEAAPAPAAPPAEPAAAPAEPAAATP